MSYSGYGSSTTESTQYGSAYSASSMYSHDSAATQNTEYTMSDEPDLNVYNPPAGSFVLPCEFVGFDRCDVVFNFDRTEEWIEHIVTTHLRDKFPSKAICWFCDNFTFDAKASAQGDRRMNFQYRMEHIRGHIADGKTANDIRPDYHMAEHLHKHRLISDRVYNQVKEWCELPCGTSHTRHIRPLGYVPPERQAERYHDSKIVVKERHRKGKGKDKGH